jgi:hypothetical protein
MILLRPDCLVFERPGSDAAPCPAETIAVELIADPALVDPAVLQEAATAVLHYFRNDLSRTVVSVAEFSAMLQKALQGLGLNVRMARLDEPDDETDLRHLAGEPNDSCELFFFPRLRGELRRKLQQFPSVIRFGGLRGCVKQLLRAKRWTPRCQTLNDQIVDYLRTCLNVEATTSPCALLVR